jgi:hypothetical protein
MLPTDLRKDAAEMVGDLVWGSQVDTVDDEYRWAGCEDPNIVVTTSRDPSSKLKIFAKVIFCYVHIFFSISSVYKKGDEAGSAQFSTH